MSVFVKSMRGEPLMPTSNQKARKLLKSKQATIYSYQPFCIQLCHPTGEATQTCRVGIDTGSKHMGFAVVQNEKVIQKGEVELRQDVSGNLTTRKLYRRERRSRKTRYRAPRFLNRRIPDHWIPPSLQSKVDITFHFIDKLCAFLPNPEIHIEVGKFDAAKMINPDIQGVDYAHGKTYGYYAERYYVFQRDQYTCQVCGKKHKILQTHHIRYQSHGGSDRVDNLITVCSDCHTHKNHEKGGIFYRWMAEEKRVAQYKEPPFMNALTVRIKEHYRDAVITYGDITTPKRKVLGLTKTHYNDAIAITGVDSVKENPDVILYIRQFRKKKRSLHEANARKGRKEPNRNQKRNGKNTPYSGGFFLNDKVAVFGQTGFITGFTNAAAYVKDICGNPITIPGKTYKQVAFRYLHILNHNNNWQVQYLTASEYPGGMACI